MEKALPAAPDDVAARTPPDGAGRAAVRALLWLVGLLPMGLRRLLARGVGLLAYGLGIRRRVTLENLARALPELAAGERSRIARGAYVNMALAMLEALYSHTLGEEEAGGRLILENWERVERALAEGKGLLVASAHFGNWELLGELMTRKGYRLHAVVRTLKGALNAELVTNRLRAGMGLIPPRGALRETLKQLKAGHVVTFLIDQGLRSKSALFVPFFGHPASTTPALSMAALRSGAPVLVVLAAREGERLRVTVQGPFPVPRTGDVHADLTAHTAALTAAIESTVRRHPEQWLWLHRRWKYLPPGAGAALPAPPASSSV